MKRILLVLALLAGTAHASPIAPGVALPPGPEELAAEAARPQQPAPQPITYVADRSPVLVAQLAASSAAQPGVSNLQQNANTPPAAALNPNIPICPPPAPAPPLSTLGKVEKWLYVAGAVIALASVTAEKLDAIVSGRASVTP